MPALRHRPDQPLLAIALNHGVTSRLAISPVVIRRLACGRQRHRRSESRATSAARALVRIAVTAAAGGQERHAVASADLDLGRLVDNFFRRRRRRGG